MKFFVYGTLRRGFGNNRLLTTAHYLGAAVTSDRFCLTNHGFPMASRGGVVLRPVLGEVYRSTDPRVIENLDILEGHPRFYCREEVPVTYADGAEEVAWMYLVEDELGRGPLCPVHDQQFYWNVPPSEYRV